LGARLRPPSLPMNSPRAGSSISDTIPSNHSRRSPSPVPFSPSIRNEHRLRWVVAHLLLSAAHPRPSPHPFSPKHPTQSLKHIVAPTNQLELLGSRTIDLLFQRPAQPRLLCRQVQQPWLQQQAAALVLRRTSGSSGSACTLCSSAAAPQISDRKRTHPV
jgi:hypothetical protein